MIDHNIFLLVFFAAFLGTAASTYFFIKYIKKFLPQLVDKPNVRSNHKKPVPRGGGLTVIAAIISLILFSSISIAGDFNEIWLLILGVIIISIISFLDDIKSKPAIIRIIFHAIAVAFGMQVLINITGVSGIFFDRGILKYISLATIFLSWLWFINLYNFMDGIDGITCSQTIFICLGISWLSIITSLGISPFIYSSIIISSCLAFLLFNWNPAKVMLGDVGSISLGYLMGFFLLYIAASGLVVSAIIIPAYYLADSSFTLLKRLFQGKKIWEAHSEHFYQQAVRNGKKSHSKVTLIIILLNLILLGLALSAAIYKNLEYAILLFSYFVVFCFLHILGKAKKI